MKYKKIGILSCQSGLGLAKHLFTKTQDIVDKKERYEWIESNEVWFANGEVKTVVQTDVCGMEVYVVQLFADPDSQRSINDNWMAFLTAIDALYQSGAALVHSIIPQYPYSRQERAAKGEGVSARQIAIILEANRVGDVLTIDLHQDAIVGFFRQSRLISLGMAPYFVHQLDSKENWTLVAPDFGAIRRISSVAEDTGFPIAFLEKQRDYRHSGRIKTMTLIGDVHHQNVLVIDDMIGSGSTMIKACKILKENGASRIDVATSFAFFNDSALQLFDKAYQEQCIHRVIATDAVFRSNEFKQRYSWYSEISVSSILISRMRF